MIEILLPCFMQKFWEGFFLVCIGASLGFWFALVDRRFGDLGDLVKWAVGGEIVMTILYIVGSIAITELPKMIAFGWVCV